MFTVIIPAHNEQNVIGRGLSALLQGASPGELEIIVVCNGCSDATADVARSFGPPVHVIDTPTPGKANALNLGDAAATRFPRVYVDGDVTLTIDSVRRIAERLGQGDVLVASPGIRWNLDGASWAVRAFYDIDRRLPSHRETIGGSGVYALSEAGRRRFSRFPELTADDAFVRRRFTMRERARVDGATSVVTPPKRLPGVIAIKTRSHFGNYELSMAHPELTKNTGQSNVPALLRLSLQPWNWAKLAVYLYVKVRARIAAQRRIRSSLPVKWERDESSRTSADVTAAGNVAADKIQHPLSQPSGMCR